jgi:hypothetical protein
MAHLDLEDPIESCAAVRDPEESILRAADCNASRSISCFRRPFTLRRSGAISLSTLYDASEIIGPECSIYLVDGCQTNAISVSRDLAAGDHWALA